MKILFYSLLFISFLGSVYLAKNQTEKIKVTEVNENEKSEAIIEPNATSSSTILQDEVLVEKEVATTEILEPKLIHINYNGVEVDAWAEGVKDEEVDMLLVYHGTVVKDSQIISSALTILEKTRNILSRDNLMIVSVAYPEEGLLLGDNIKQSEAALLWAKNKASAELGIKINKIYLFGHSQGGYLVTRLNTMHKTDGVIANAPGPIDLSYRCQFDEKSKKAKQEFVCTLLREEYGSVFTNPTAYRDRSLISFASGHKTKILFIQGLEDSDIQLKLWPEFKMELNKCTDCASYEFLELSGFGHGAVFDSSEAKARFNEFLK
ncbi:MAG: Alpha/beta hydrolase family protein [Parcubacteria bacterium OLB19]|nr:MAG: Alpha/beta hydrolase family protein [Parcubacteria bacterium OLB19]